MNKLAALFVVLGIVGCSYNSKTSNLKMSSVEPKREGISSRHIASMELGKHKIDQEDAKRNAILFFNKSKISEISVSLRDYKWVLTKLGHDKRRTFENVPIYVVDLKGDIEWPHGNDATANPPSKVIKGNQAFIAFAEDGTIVAAHMPTPVAAN